MLRRSIIPLLAGPFARLRAGKGSTCDRSFFPPTYHHPLFPCSSVVEQLAVNEKVAGSNPAGGAMNHSLAALAQVHGSAIVRCHGFCCAWSMPCTRAPQRELCRATCFAVCCTAMDHFWYVYVLRSAEDKKFYIGSTNDLHRRVDEHQSGKNISTAKRLPMELWYFEGHRSKEDAIRREKYFKTTKGKVMLRQILRTSLDSSEASA